ncbi:hypothetical protein BAL199_29165 [alpha proteobacterium BAL199]|jgi:hypothetical protein|nr:hypothetical protein BAL199_29165 [alpha proteobacterium BAL199]
MTLPKIARTDVTRLTTDIDALDTVIRLFAPEVDGRGVKARRLPSPFVARKGQIVSTGGRMMYLCRATDAEGEGHNLLMQRPLHKQGFAP